MKIADIQEGDRILTQLGSRIEEHVVTEISPSRGYIKLGEKWVTAPCLNLVEILKSNKSLSKKEMARLADEA